MKETMTSKERWLAVLRREKPDRVPLDYWGTPEATEKIMGYLGCAGEDDMFARLHIDHPLDVGPHYAGPPLEPGVDMYGCCHEDVDYGAGAYSEIVYHPLAPYTSADEIEDQYTWPTADWFDYSVIPAQLAGNEHRPVRGGGSEPFLQYTYLRGLEQAYMDLVLNPEMVHYCLDKLFDFAYENTRRIYEQIPGQVTFSYVAEDMGSQERLLFSKRHIHEFLLPRMKRIMDLVHEGGAAVFTHSDGAIRPVIPDLIAIGMDVLNPIQWRCHGMERAGLKHDFGAQIIFHGGMDNQQTLAFGSVEDVQKEVVQNLAILGAGGGYILAPCHNIQAISPPENIVALYETGYHEGWI
ncbi:MAG TPA: uroporphyrinogen decarboxylase family protein [Anaerolineae bacterium]|nr:uroporphyrinogen decarboxylase family protein [Anaerolineae bacterium]HQH37771.1 uroporphyrinogen decarboxylase family protein [Anaerolineae bacterium]